MYFSNNAYILSVMHYISASSGNKGRMFCRNKHIIPAKIIHHGLQNAAELGKIGISMGNEGGNLMLCLRIFGKSPVDFRSLSRFENSVWIFGSRIL